MKKRKIIITALSVLALTVAVLSCVFTFGKAVLCIMLVLIGIVFTAVPVIYFIRILAAEIYVAKNGRRINAKCIKHIPVRRWRNATMVVEWKDSEGITKQRKFAAFKPRFKPPYDVKLCTLDDPAYQVNLGVLTILYILPYLLFFLIVWAVCTIGTIHLLFEIL